MEQQNAIVLLRNRSVSYKGVSKKLADVILGDLDAFISMTIKELSQTAGVAQSSIVRFYQSLGFPQYADFKINIAKNLKQQDISQKRNVRKKDAVQSVVDNTAQISIQAILDSVHALDVRKLSQAVNWLARARRIDFYGMGTSSMLVHDCYYRIMRIGYPCFFATDPHIMRTSASSLDKYSIAFAISYTGRSKDTLRAIEIAKDKGAKTICLTGFDSSPLYQIADCPILCISNEVKAFGESYANTVAQKVILDSIYNCLAMKKAIPQKYEELQALLEETRI